jgi:hypothetical protein
MRSGETRVRRNDPLTTEATTVMRSRETRVRRNDLLTTERARTASVAANGRVARAVRGIARTLK